MNRVFIYCERMVHLLTSDEILALEGDGLVTATFRRLDTDRQRAVSVAILEEALTRGPSKIRLKEMAASAGVSVGSLYQYFGNRQGVLRFAITLASHRLAEDLAGYVPLLCSLPLADGLTAWVTGGLEWTREQAAVMGFFVRGAYEGDADLAERLVAPIAQVMVEAIEAMLSAAVHRGEARADLDVAATARAVHVLLAGIGDAQLLPHLGRYFRVADDHVSFEQTLAAAVDLVVAGVRA